eukprot:5958057-Amphidinium_carterae.2
MERAMGFLALRQTKGEERELWRQSLKKELDNLIQQKTFLRVGKPKGYNPPARCVFTLKPTAKRIPKRKSRIVLCGNFVPAYSNPTTSNIDASVLRLVLNVAVQKKWLIGTLDVPGAFLHADMDESRRLVCQPPNILREFNLIADGEYWQVVKALYGLRKAPKYWEAFGCSLFCPELHSCFCVACCNRTREGRLEAARNHHPVDKRAFPYCFPGQVS